MRLISKMPTLAAIAYKTAIGRTPYTCLANSLSCLLCPTMDKGLVCSMCIVVLLCSPVLVVGSVNCFLREVTCAGQPIVYPRNDLTYTENILHMMFSLPSERYQVDPVLSKALEVILILHMDHEQNASTSTVRVAGKACTLPFLYHKFSQSG